MIDGEHERVIQNTGPVTYYLGGYTEVTVNGSSTTTTNYYGAGVSTAVAVNGTITYLVADGLGSASESLSSSGSVQGAQLFAPYGSVRYSTGSMSTTKGFTGQLSDPSGLSYFHARYYDPVVGQFTSADTVQGPNRYAYVAGNPETLTDPTGQYISGGPGSGDSCFVENGKCVTETNGNGTDDGTPPTPCNNTDHCLHPVQPGNGVKPPKRDHAAVLLDRQSCLGSFCVDLTLLDALKLHIDTTALAKAIADAMIWGGAVVATIATVIPILGLGDDPVTAWAVPRLLGVAIIAIGALIAGLPAIISEFISALGGDNSAFSDILKGLYALGTQIMGAGALIAILGGIPEVIAEGWTVMKALTLIAAGFTFLGSVVWNHANQGN